MPKAKAKAAAPTIHDLAAELRVSSTTVWRALHNRSRIDPETRRRILARAKAVGYVPSLVARNLSQGRTGTLGIVVPMLGHPVFAALVEAVERAAFARGYSLAVGDSRMSLDLETAHARMFLERRVEGAIVVPFAKRPNLPGASGGDAHLRALEKRGVPVVLLEQDLPGTRFPRVVADNFGAAREVVRHLVSLGHRRIAFAFHPVHAWDPVGAERLAGFKAGMAEAGLAKNATLLLDAAGLPEGGGWVYRPETIAAAFKKTPRARPTALFAGMDHLAIRAMGTLRDLGIRVPEEAAVAGFDNVEFSAFTVPPLTTVEQPTAAMGLRAAELLFARIEGRETGFLRERLSCRLVVRASCGPAPTL